jgi:DNA modification methylase
LFGGCVEDEACLGQVLTSFTAPDQMASLLKPMQNLSINPELKALIPPLTSEEFAQLEANVCQEGIREPIITWQGTIVDGHNRYELAQMYDLPFKVKEMQFSTMEDCMDWMINNQLGRRNVTEPQKAYLIGKKYENEKQRLGGQTKGVGQNVPPVSTAERLGEEFGISDKQVKRNEDFAKGVDLLANVEPELKGQILQGKSDLNKQDVQEFGKISKQAQKEVKQSAIFVSDEELKRQINERAAEMAKAKLAEMEEEKKNHFAKVASKIKDNDLKPQSELNSIVAQEFDVKMHEVYLINNKHKLIVADSFNDIEFIKKQANKIDCVLTDPPYGISYKSPSGNGLAQRGDYGVIQGDNIEFEPSILFQYSKNVIAWGGNYYSNKLENSAGWLVWDKRDGKAINLNSDCELAWSNMLNSARLFHHTWNGMIKASEHGSKRIHPTQKPIKLFEWCLEISKAGEFVIDIFAGSGIIIPACENTNRVAIAVEMDLTFAAAILKRLNEMGYSIQKV